MSYTGIPKHWETHTEDFCEGVLDRLQTFAARVEWVGVGAERAFADSVLELAGFLDYRQRVALGLDGPKPHA